jgi:hypothetical protein
MDMACPLAEIKAEIRINQRHHPKVIKSQPRTPEGVNAGQDGSQLRKDDGQIRC